VSTLKQIKLPYYQDSLVLNIAEKNLTSVLTSKMEDFKPRFSQERLVGNALKSPIGSERLRELAKNKNKVVIITSDHTRSVPSKITLPLLLAEIRWGNPDADITILVATGLHRATTIEEMLTMFGDNIVAKEKIVVHNAFDESSLIFVDTLPSGGELKVNKLAVEADLLVCEGFIEPHFFAGFSGGRKSILPGISSKETVNWNHSARAIGHPLSKTGILDGNPIHEDMIYGAQKVGVDFILNVALDADKKIIAAFAGSLDKAHRKGCEFVSSLAKVNKVTGDIVVTSNGGYPLDQNLYQSPKAISTAAQCAGDDGVIIIAASCCDGVGGVNFEKLMLKGSPQEILDFVSSVPDQETIPEQWCAQILSQILLKHQLILVTTFLDHEIIKKMNILPASTLDVALNMAYEIKGENASVVVIPDGVAVMAG
jgi:nickel-dependent lactate racemase